MADDKGRSDDGPASMKSDRKADQESGRTTSRIGSALGRISPALGNAGVTGLAAAQTGGRAAANWVRNLATRFVGMMMGAGTGISGFLGGAISPKTGAMVAGGGSVASVLLVMSLIGGFAYNATMTGKRDGIIEDCMDLITAGAADASFDSGEFTGDIDKQTEENAKKIYSILKYAGMNDENIAGILGNWSNESGIDPTSVETIFDEKFTIGPKKKRADSVGYDVKRYDPAYAARYPLIKLLGIGLGAWTDTNDGSTRQTDLRNYAKSKGGDWWELEIQMAFMLGGDAEGSRKIVQSMIDGTNPGHDDPREAASFFLAKWEGVPGDWSQNNRTRDAGMWYARMSGWSVDTNLAKSVLAMANTGKGSADGKEVQNVLNQCPGMAGDSGGAAGNSDAAVAMVTLAWPFYEQGKAGSPTEKSAATKLYQYMLPEMYPGDPFFASCDRAVATAVKWSGTDDSFPQGATGQQYQYFTGEGKSKWKDMGTPKDESMMKPGDVLITHGDGHIFMYVGKEAVEKVYGNVDHEEGAVIAQASYGEYSNGLQSGGFWAANDSEYEVFRIKKPESNSKYKDVKVPNNIKPGT